MGALNGLYPEAVFTAFEQICAIPHGSYHIDAISDHLKAFAEKQGYECIQDAEKNILVRVPAFPPAYRQDPVLILQGHMDMVAVHDDPSVDMNVTPVKVGYEGDWVYAEHSSLGGDDGIAVAMMMAIMQDKTIPHPPLELLITTNEEVGMDGAVGLDASLLRGKRLLNLDSEDEGIFTVGCAGGVRVVAHLPFAVSGEEAHVNGFPVRIRIRGGQGGHSGQMIHLGRANANRLLMRALETLATESGAALQELNGGTACNAIPAEAEMCVIIERDRLDEAIACLRRIREQICAEYREKDPEVGLEWDDAETGAVVESRTSAAYAQKLARMVLAEPDGVQAVCKEPAGLTETSLNLGILRIEGDAVAAYFELRSMKGAAAEELRDKVASIARENGADTEISASYPEWEYREKSPLRDKMVKIYREQFGKDPVVEVIHAGLECGVLAKKIEDFDAVSIGPDMQDIHTTREKLNIASVGRTWEFVLEILKRKD